MFKERMLETMYICEVYGHHDKMARTKTNTQNNTKTGKTLRRNRHLEKTKLCKFGVAFIKQV